LLAELVGIASPFVCELEEEGAAFGVFGLFGRASAFVGVTFVELSEHGSTSPEERRKARYPVSAIHLVAVSRGDAVGFMSSSVKCART
jgi:hypothetical protein